MLRRLDDNLWCSDSSVRLPGGVHMPARMTVVRLDDGLWLHSPLPFDDATTNAVRELGEVAHIVAPNCFHHLHVAAAAERFPDASIHAPRGLRAKRPDLRIDADLQSGAERWPAMDVIEIDGAPELDEFVFFHRPSGSLIVTDLVFNIHEARGLMLPLVLRMVGAWRRLNQSRIWRRYTKDRSAAAAAVQLVLDHEIRRVIPAHGDVLEAPDTREQLAGALAWMRAGAA
ncbi:MAG TPA: DUF4336 domain-containing protein [Enhygromyxa sp.]|nr:DUF4336 domain-containing protein [Enhygromyxa sp.]